jgi:hypothetical protein
MLKKNLRRHKNATKFAQSFFKDLDPVWNEEIKNTRTIGSAGMTYRVCNETEKTKEYCENGCLGHMI